MKNGVATWLKVLSYIELIGGAVAGYFASDSFRNGIFLWYGIIIGVICFSLFRGFAEVIQLLQDIKNKQEPKPNATTNYDELPDL